MRKRKKDPAAGIVARRCAARRGGGERDLSRAARLFESAAEQARLRACVEPHYRAMQHKQLQVQQLTAAVASLQHQVASLQQTMQQMAHQHQRRLQQAQWHPGRV